MAYFLWDDQGVLSLVKELESPLADDFTNVFSPVEKVDIFRIMVCKWFGGIVSAEQHARRILVKTQADNSSTGTLTRNLSNIPPVGFSNPTLQNGPTN